MKKVNENDFLTGSITGILFQLSIPIILTSLIEMAYSIVDMLFIGRLGSYAVAGVGIAGMLAWFSDGLCMLAAVGGQVKIGHSLGAHNEKEAGAYFTGMMQTGFLFGTVFTAVILLFTNQIVGFFHLSNPESVSSAVVYMRIFCGLILFYFMDVLMTAAFNVSGDTRTPFIINTIGFLLNIFLDPMLIFGIGPFPEMGVAGAAIASVGAEILVFLLLLAAGRKKNRLFRSLHPASLQQPSVYGSILRIGAPVALQNMLFSVCSMIIATFIAGYGDGAVAAQKVGSQIESITWMTADGFMTAINTFISHNFGAQKYKRVHKGYIAIMKIVLVWGLFCTLLLVAFPGQIFSLFLDDPAVLPIGIRYLRIIGFSELFMCMEITTTGAFGGLGYTLPPSIVSTLLTLARIPMLLVLTRTALGLDGIWVSISLSSILKGIVLSVWYLHYEKKLLKAKA